MNKKVELTFHVLRRLDFPSLGGGRSVGPDIPWLRSELREFIERRSADALFDNLLGQTDACGRSEDLVEHIRELVASGWVEVSLRPFANGMANLRTSVVDDVTELVSLALPEEVVEMSPESAREPIAASAGDTAQVSALIAAARFAIPFCEICAAEP